MSFSISSVPRTYIGKLMLWHKMQTRAEEDFDNEEQTYTYEMCESEYELFELIQTLGTDFVSDLIQIIELTHPSAGMAQSVGEVQDAIDAHR